MLYLISSPDENPEEVQVMNKDEVEGPDDTSFVMHSEVECIRCGAPFTPEYDGHVLCDEECEELYTGVPIEDED